MSTGKRLATRSILGTRVVVPGEDGRFYPGLIQVRYIDLVREYSNFVRGSITEWLTSYLASLDSFALLHLS